MTGEYVQQKIRQLSETAYRFETGKFISEGWTILLKY